MREKKDDLKAKDTVFEKVDESKEEAAKRRSEHIAGSSSDLVDSIKADHQERFGDKGNADDFSALDGDDFSFVPKEGSTLSKEVDAKSLGIDPEILASLVDEGSNLPFGEADAEIEPAVVKAATTAAVAKKSTPLSEDSESDAPFGEAPESKETAKEPEKKSKSKVEEMEVIPREEEKPAELSKKSESTQAVSKWAFWKRPSRRDEQLARISDGYVEMVDLVRAISGQLESQNKNNMILRDSLAHLPDAMKGLESFSKSQHAVGEALQEIHGQIQRSGERDDKLVDSMDGFNTTLQGLDVTNQASVKTFDRVQERMFESDLRIEGLFENAQETEVKLSDTMVKLQRNMAIMQGVFLFCLLLVIGVLVFVIIDREGQDSLPTPDPEAVVDPTAKQKAPTGVTPREARDVRIPLTK